MWRRSYLLRYTVIVGGVDDFVVIVVVCFCCVWRWCWRCIVDVVGVDVVFAGVVDGGGGDGVSVDAV